MRGTFLVRRTDSLPDVGKFNISSISEVVDCDRRVERQMVREGPLLVIKQNVVLAVVVAWRLPSIFEALFDFWPEHCRHLGVNIEQTFFIDE